MDDAIAPVETYPWDRLSVPQLTAQLMVVAETPIEVADHDYDPAPGHVSLVRFGGLDLHVGLMGGDAEVIEISDRVIRAFTELRDNAGRRMSEPLPTADDVRGILADRPVPA